MPNIVDALSKLENDLKINLSLDTKVKVLASFKDRELLEFLLQYRFGNKYFTYKDTTVKRIKVVEGEKKKWWNYPLPVDKIVGTFKRFSYLRKILESDIGNATYKFEKLKEHCYRQEWNLYRRIINKEFFNETILINGVKDQTSLIPRIILKQYGIGNTLQVKFMRCDDGKPSFPCFIEPKLPGMRVRMITGESFKAFTYYEGKLWNITAYFPTTYCQIEGNYEIDGIIRTVKFGSDYQEGLVNSLIPAFFAIDCCNSEKLSYIERKKLLLKVASVVPITVVPFIEINSLEEAIKFKDNCINKGYRGAILKQRNSFYIPTYSNKWIDISDEQLTTVKIINVMGTRTCDALIVTRNGIECVAKVKEVHQNLLWKQRHTFLGKYCCIDKDNCFIKFNPNKA